MWRVDLKNQTAAPIQGPARVGLDEIDGRSFSTFTDRTELSWWTRFYRLSNDGSLALHGEYDGEGG